MLTNVRFRWLALVALAACAPVGPQESETEPTTAYVEPRDAAHPGPRDAAQVRPGDAAQLGSGDAGQLESGDAAQLGPKDAGRVEPGDAAQLEPRDAGRVDAGDAGRTLPKDAGHLATADAAPVGPIDAGPSDVGEPDPLEGLATGWQARAASYLEQRSASWLASPPDFANVKCALSCHTTFAYMLARPSLAPFANTGTADAVRSRLEERVAEAAAGTAVPFYGQNADAKTTQSFATESVLNAAAIALDDIGSGSALSASAKSALDRMWSQQRTDGTWDWLEFGLEPWEARNDFGAAIAALVVGSIPAKSSSSQATGTSALIGYVQRHLASMVLHDRALILYASGKLTTLLEPAQAQAIAADLAATQLADGGFSLGAWGQGAIASKVAQKCDGYATAVAVLALCTGLPAGAQRADVKRALGWLAHKQAADGSWPGQSVNDTTEQVKGFMTDAATAYVSIALTRCAPAGAQQRSR